MLGTCTPVCVHSLSCVLHPQGPGLAVNHPSCTPHTPQWRWLLVKAVVGPRVGGREVGRPKSHGEDLLRGSELLAFKNLHLGWGEGQGRPRAGPLLRGLSWRSSDIILPPLPWTRA